MINEAVELLTKKREKQKQDAEKNKKRYWKLFASDKLHYDSRVEKIISDNSCFFNLTQLYAKVFFYLFAFLFFLRYLLDVDRGVFVKPVLSLVSILPKIFMFIIAMDIIFLLVTRLYTKPRAIREINKRYGFK